MPDFPRSGRPIFILGILQRSGTNYLADLLRLHPDCGAPAPIWEDFLLHHADLLVKYANSATASWRHWVGDERVGEALCQSLGAGLLSFLSARSDKQRLVTKTPSVRNLRYFFRFFPQADLLILIRDGRAVVESTVKSFQVDFESAVRQWAQAAETIVQFDKSMKDSPYRYLIVRYEDLWNHLDQEMKKVFDFLELNQALYDFESAVKLPVRGSSVFGKGTEERVHWNPVQKSADFNPVERWTHWSRAKHERFNWVAGKYLNDFGYEQKVYPDRQAIWTIWNKGVDLQWRCKAALRGLSMLSRRVSARIFPMTKAKAVSLCLATSLLRLAKEIM